MKILLAVLLTASLISMISCAKQIVSKFTYETNAKSVVYIKHQAGSGTGFYIGNGIIVTARHVVPDLYIQYQSVIALKFKAEDIDGNTFKLTKVYESEVNDIAFLRIEDGHNLTSVRLADKNPATGDRLYMIGHPAGFKWSYSEGYVVNTPIKFINDSFAMVSDIACFFGSSGSAVYNESGEVVGIMNALFKTGSLAIGHTVRTIKEDLETYMSNE